MSGHWRGVAFGGAAEVWGVPEANSMVGMYRLMVDGEVVLHELMSNQPDGSSVALLLRH